MERLKEEPPFPHIPEYKGGVLFFEDVPIHVDKSSWTFKGENGQEKETPVYSVWNYKHHDEIADRIARGEVALLYMWGTYGVGKVINSPEWQKEKESEVLSMQLKKGRPKDMPFVPFMYPEDMIDFWDIDRLHPSYRHLQWANKREKLYEAGPVHIIVPAKESNPHLDPSLIRYADYSTAFYYMPHPAMERIIKKVRRQVHHGVFAGGSANFHREQPAFTTGELRIKMEQKPEWIEKVDLVLVCEIGEAFKIFEGHTQLRLPQIESDGISQIVRIGARSPQRWSELTGYPIKPAPEGVKEAPSVTPYTPESIAVIDQRVTDSREAMNKFDKEAKTFLKAA